MSETFAPRRIFLRTAVLGGVAAATLQSNPAEAAVWQPRGVSARDLRVGDMISGPDGGIVRVAETSRLGPRVRIRYTSPHGDTRLAMRMANDGLGFAATQSFVVYARGIASSSVQLGPAAAPTSTVIDGGRP